MKSKAANVMSEVSICLNRFIAACCIKSNGIVERFDKKRWILTTKANFVTQTNMIKKATLTKPIQA